MSRDLTEESPDFRDPTKGPCTKTFKNHANTLQPHILHAGIETF